MYIRHLKKKSERTVQLTLQAIFFRMDFLPKYIAFVAAFMSTATFADNVPINYVDATNVTSLMDYASVVEDYHCVAFTPTMTDPLDVSTLDADTLYQLLSAYYNGDMLEVCVPIESRALAVRSKEKRVVCGGLCIFALGMVVGMLIS